MTREEKVTEFFNKTKLPAHWCNAKMCACMGCVNKMGVATDKWHAMFPEDSYLTKEDIDLYHASNR